MRIALATVLVFSLCSCHHPAVSPQAPAPSPTSEVASEQRIAVGDTMDEVGRRIIANGGKDCTRSIGIIDYPLSTWYILKDGTGLQVTPAATSEAGRDVVGRLTLGESGRGYGGKLEWFEQHHREFAVIELW